MYRKLTNLFLVCLILCSCSEQRKDYSFKLDSTIEIERPKNTKDFFFSQYLYSDGVNYLLGLEKLTNNLFVFNLDKKTLHKYINIPTNKKVHTFFAKNLNEIYFVPKYYFEIYKLSNYQNIDTIFKNDINNLLSLSKKFNLGNNLEFAFSTISPFKVNDSLFYLPNSIMVDSNFILDGQKTFFVIDCLRDTVIINSKIGHFPEKMISYTKSIHPFDAGFSYTLNKDKIIISFFADHSIYVYDFLGFKKSYECKSLYIQALPDFIEKSQIYNRELIGKRGMTLASYGGIYFDKYNNLYYRTVKHKNPIDKNGLVNFQKFKYSIMILDSNFNCIGEQVFDNTVDQMYTILVSKKGLMIKNPDLLDGVTRYSLYKIIKNE